MKTILVPTDFSPDAQHALEWTRYVANHTKATIVLLHVYQMPMPDTTLPTVGDLGMGAVATAELEQIGRENLEKLANQLRVEGFMVETEWRLGNVEDEIVRAAHELDVDLIVTGRSEMTGFFDRLLGSSATDIARSATCPVLVVPNVNAEQASQPAQIRQVTYASQLEFDERESMIQALTFARTFGATLHLIKVDADNQPNIYDDRHFIEQLKSQHGDIPLDLETVKARSVTAGLTDYLQEHPTDLLVMTTRERGFLANLVNPSETERMLERAEVPVLVLHG
jgi:nucleotide-binding universal stress UspA family protein